MKGRSQKFLLLTSLYLAQGLPFGFFTQALPILMRKQGLGLPAISLSGLLAMPWALKFLWAPIVDRYGSPSFGRRRSWIIPLQFAAILTTTGLAFTASERGIPILMGAVLLTNLIAATQDIATDGLAVDMLNDQERGFGNGIQVAGYRVGMILGGGALLYVFDELGWQRTFLCMAAVLGLSSLPIAFYNESNGGAAKKIDEPIQAGHWTQMLRRPKMLLWLSVLITYKL